MLSAAPIRSLDVQVFHLSISTIVLTSSTVPSMVFQISFMESFVPTFQGQKIGLEVGICRC